MSSLLPQIIPIFFFITLDGYYQKVVSRSRWPTIVMISYSAHWPKLCFREAGCVRQIDNQGTCWARAKKPLASLSSLARIDAKSDHVDWSLINEIKYVVYSTLCDNGLKANYSQNAKALFHQQNMLKCRIASFSALFAKFPEEHVPGRRTPPPYQYTTIVYLFWPALQV